MMYFYTIILFVMALLAVLLTFSAFYHLVSNKNVSESFTYKCVTFLVDRVSLKSVLLIFVVLPLCLTIINIGLNWPKAPRRGRLLQKELQDSSMLRIRSGGLGEREKNRSLELYKTADLNEINEIINVIAFKPSSFFLGNCHCHGDMTFEFYNNEELVLEFSFHHENHFRIAGEPLGDLNLTQESKFFFSRWVAKKGIRKKLNEFQEQRRLRPLLQ